MAEFTREELELGFDDAIASGNDSAANSIASALTRMPLPKTPITQEQEQTFPPFDLEGNFIPSEPKPEVARPLYEDIVGVGETALTLGTAATSGALGGVFGFEQGIRNSILDGTFGTKQGAKSVEDSFNEGAAALTFSPRTERGQELTQGTAKFLQKVVPPVIGFGSELTNAANLLKTSPQLSRVGQTLRGKEPKPVSDEIRGLQESQILLSKDGGGLTAFQTEGAGKFRNFAEKVGQIGLLSRSKFQNQRQLNTNFLSRELSELINGENPTLAVAKGDVGRALLDTVTKGKEAISTIYRNDLDSLVSDFGANRVNVRPLVANLERYLKSKDKDFGSTLDGTTLKVVNDVIGQLNLVNPALQKRKSIFARNEPVDTSLMGDVDSLIALEKKIGNEIKKVGTFGVDGFNNVASAELAEVSELIRGSINKIYKNQGMPELASRHLAAKETFSTLSKELMPKDIKSIIKKGASTSDVETIGNILVSANSPDKVASFMKSIDTSFFAMKKAGAFEELGVIKSPAMFRDMVRQSYLKNLLGEVPKTSDGLFVGKYTGLFDNLNNPTNSAAVKAVLGDKFGTYKRLTKALKDSSIEQRGDPMSLAIRSLEFGGVLGIVTGGVIASPITFVPALGALLAPAILARWASNPKAVNSLLKLRKLDSNLSTTATNVLGTIETIIVAMPREEDRKAARDAIAEAEKKAKEKK